MLKERQFIMQQSTIKQFDVVKCHNDADNLNKHTKDEKQEWDVGYDIYFLF